MKKIFIALLCFSVLFVTACGSRQNPTNSSDSSVLSNNSTSNSNVDFNSTSSESSLQSILGNSTSSTSQSNSQSTSPSEQSPTSPTNFGETIDAFLDGAKINDQNFINYVKNLGDYSLNTAITQNAIFASPTGKGDGTIDSPFSLQDAFDSVQAGQTLYLRGGTYNPSNSDGYYLEMQGNANGYITIRNYPNEKVTITNTHVGSEVYAFNFGESFAYTVIEGLEISSVIGKCAYGMVSWGNMNHVVIRNCQIHDVKTNSSKPETDSNAGANALLLFGEKTVPISNVVIMDNKCYNNVTGWSETLSVTANCEYVYVLRNTVSNNTNIGIDFYGNNSDGYCSTPSLNQPRYCVAAGNTIENSFCSYADCAGLYVDGSRDIIVQGNVIKNCQYGIEIGSEERQDDYPVKNILVRNNVCLNNSVVGIRVGGYEISSTGIVYSTEIINNTFINNNAQMIFAKCDGITVKNNAFYSNKAVDTMYTDFSETYCKNISIENNFFSLYGTNAQNLSFNMFEKNQSSLSAFNSLVGTNYVEQFDFDDKFTCTSETLSNRSQQVNYGRFDFYLSQRVKNSVADIGAVEK